MTKAIKLPNPDAVALFVKKAETLIPTGEVLVRRGKYIVDGQSIMGIFSLDPAEGVTVDYPADAAEFDEFLNQFE